MPRWLWSRHDTTASFERLVAKTRKEAESDGKRRKFLALTRGGVAGESGRGVSGGRGSVEIRRIPAGPRGEELLCVHEPGTDNKAGGTDGAEP